MIVVYQEDGLWKVAMHRGSKHPQVYLTKERALKAAELLTKRQMTQSKEKYDYRHQQK